MDGTYLLATCVPPLPAPVQAPGPVDDDASIPLSLRRTSGCCPGEIRCNCLVGFTRLDPGDTEDEDAWAHKTSPVVAGHEEMIPAMSLSVAFTESGVAAAYHELPARIAVPTAAQNHGSRAEALIRGYARRAHQEVIVQVMT
jgi:hypothetical protein